MPVLLLFLLALPFVELAGLIRVGEVIGLWPTLGLVLAAGIAGITLMRRQGYATLLRAQASMARRESPLPGLLHGFAILIAGALLVVPGFVTDIVALLLLLRPVRTGLGLWLWTVLMRSGRVSVWASARAAEAAGRGTVIDGEYREVDERREGPPRLR